VSPPPSTDWRRIRMSALLQLTTTDSARPWTWDVTDPVHPRLVAPWGRRWLFRLRHGAWIKPEPTTPPHTT